MKKIIKRSFYAALVFLLFVSGNQAKATHEFYLGNEISYEQISANSFQVYLTIYQGCGAQYRPSEILNVTSPGCNIGRSITMSRLSGVRVATPYCSTQLNACTSAQMNYQEVKFSATVIFTPAEMACPDWVLSWGLNTARHRGQNISNSASDLYGEARLKLLPGMVNNSPKFGFLASSYVRHNQPAQINSYAIDPDGDSLVYSIQNPLQAYNTLIPYAQFPNTILYNADSSKYSPLNGPYSNNYPLLSYTIDWSQPMPVFPVKKFNLNTKTGTLNFIPKSFSSNTPAFPAVVNFNTLVVQVDEYRKINNIMVKIGTVRRDMLYTTVGDTGNHNPEITNAVANGQPVSENDAIYLRPGTPLNLQLATSDADASDILTLTSDVADILAGAVFNATTVQKPTATLNWTPTTAHIRDQIYYFRILVEDNACPLKGQQVYTFGVKVSATGGVTGTNKDLQASAHFSAFPNPFSQKLFFKVNLSTKAESIAIYNLLGQKVDQITLSQAKMGENQIEWEKAGKFASGTYIARLMTGNKTVQTLKFTRLQ